MFKCDLLIVSELYRITVKRMEIVMKNLRIQLMIIGAVALGFLAVHLASRPKTVVLDEAHWDCGNTDAVGIDARCTMYIMKPLAKSIGK